MMNSKWLSLDIYVCMYALYIPQHAFLFKNCNENCYRLVYEVTCYIKRVTHEA